MLKRQRSSRRRRGLQLARTDRFLIALRPTRRHHRRCPHAGVFRLVARIWHHGIAMADRWLTSRVVALGLGRRSLRQYDRRRRGGAVLAARGGWCQDGPWLCAPRAVPATRTMQSSAGSAVSGWPGPSGFGRSDGLLPCSSPTRWDSRVARRIADIEDVGAFLAPFHRIAREQVEQFGGVIAKFIGDGVMAIFGAQFLATRTTPLSVPSRSSSGCRYCGQNSDSALHVRIGVQTGKVLLRFEQGGGVDCVGDTVTLPPLDWRLRRRSTACSSVSAPAALPAGGSDHQVAPVLAKGKSRPLVAAVARGARGDDPGTAVTPVRRPGRGAGHRLWSRFTGVCTGQRGATRCWCSARPAPARAVWCTTFGGGSTKWSSCSVAQGPLGPYPGSATGHWRRS